jgi:hypothetical protein
MHVRVGVLPYMCVPSAVSGGGGDMTPPTFVTEGPTYWICMECCYFSASTLNQLISKPLDIMLHCAAC